MDEPDDTERMWEHRYESWGGWRFARICVSDNPDAEIGYTLDRTSGKREMYFMPGRDITVGEIASFKAAALSVGYDIVVVDGGLPKFKQFIHESRDTLDSMFVAAVDYLIGGL